MKKLNKLVIAIFLLLFVTFDVFAAGGNRTGTGGAAQLLIPVGARGIALGSANLAGTTGIDALYWNPAGVAISGHSVDVTFSHMNYIADIGVEYGAVAAKVEGLGTFALAIKNLSIGEIPVTTTTNPDGTGATFSPQMMTAGITFSRSLTDNISVGVTGNLITETLDQVSATGVSFDAGVIYRNLGNVNGLAFGVAMKNIGPQMQYDGSGLFYQASVDDQNRPPQYYKAESAPFELPSTFEIGFAYTPQFDDVNVLNLQTSFQNNNFSADEYKFGAEYAYNNLFFIRGGYTYGANIDSEDFIYGLTAGVGINYDVEGMALKVDYAFRDVEYFDANHIFQVSLGF